MSLDTSQHRRKRPAKQRQKAAPSAATRTRSTKCSSTRSTKCRHKRESPASAEAALPSRGELPEFTHKTHCQRRCESLLVYANANAGLGYAAKSQQRKQKMRTAKPERQLDTRYEEMSRINHSFPIMRWTWRWTTGSELQGHFSDLRLRCS